MDIDNNQLYAQIADLLIASRQSIVRSVNHTMVMTYFKIGKMVVENEQKGNERAAYGKHVLKDISAKLTMQFGKGFSVENLDRMRFFYKIYGSAISSTLSTKFNLTWSHYLVLMRMENVDERNFYEIEAAANSWSLREMKRQINTALYMRLALSRDKEGIKQLAEKGHIVEKPVDMLKDPYILEFLDLKEHYRYSESDLENEIIDKLEHFLLELGKGFTFVGRQVRFTFDEKHFKVDLVFFNRLLRCFVVIDLKLGEMTHQDLGQMQMYVNYYDRHVKLADEKPTIGILLCQKKNNAIVELTLPQDANIYASSYSLYLPDKKLLQQKLTEWLSELHDFGNNE